MQVFNSFQEMAAGTGALGRQGQMSVFNAGQCPTCNRDLADEINDKVFEEEYDYPDHRARARAKADAYKKSVLDKVQETSDRTAAYRADPEYRS